MAGVRKRVQKKKDIKLTSGLLHVQTSTNNTILTLTDEQ
jgi:ribosomal protein S11